MPDFARLHPARSRTSIENVAAEHLKKVLDGFIGAEVSQPFDCPEPGLRLRFVDVGDQQLVNAFWLDPAIGKHT
jgi:hypothetical protein